MVQEGLCEVIPLEKKIVYYKSYVLDTPQTTSAKEVVSTYETTFIGINQKLEIFS